MSDIQQSIYLFDKRDRVVAKKYPSILVPFDGSEYSKRALDEAIEISKRLDSKLHILMAVAASAVKPPGIILSGAVKGKGASKSINEYLERALDEAEQLMQKNALYCNNKGADSSYTVTVGNPSQVILDHAKKFNNSLIVMGSQGLRGITKVKVLGSVSRQILENATCPVMVVH